MLLFDWANFKTLKYGNYTFPMWANVIGWIISVYGVAAIPLKALVNVCQTRGATLGERIVSIFLKSGVTCYALIRKLAETAEILQLLCFVRLSPYHSITHIVK